MTNRFSRATLGTWSAIALGSLVALVQAAAEESLPTGPGGLQAAPQMESVTYDGSSATNPVVLKWKGYAAPYSVMKSATLGGGDWMPVATNLNTHSIEIPNTDPHAFFRIEGHAPNYAGSDECFICHEQWDEWAETRHARAFATLQNIHMDGNPNCAVCHTVALGSPTGFSMDTNSPNHVRFMNVQCENCHGPSGNHAASTALGETPVRSLSASICGGCHTGPHHPNFEEWASSGHAEVTPDVAGSLLTGGEARMKSCGACHSGAVRYAMLKSVETGTLKLPTGEEAAETGITCAVCHDPHAEGQYVAQVRNPLYSLQNFSYSTASSTDFATQYDPTLNLCGQCHNMRGATWKDTSRPPHHSPQYNMLVGKGGYEEGTPMQSPHGTLITNQCAQCHMAQVPAPAPSLENPNINGHTFKPVLTENSCKPCHLRDPETMERVVARTHDELTNTIANVKALLDTWATTKAPEQLRTNYGALSWEYSNVGALSNPLSTPGVTGPASTNQTLIPDGIKQARFNLYFVQHDGSFGMHNADYARYLLKVAADKVQAELQ